MASLWQQARSPFKTACITCVVGQSRKRIKKSTATADRKLAQRIADELEEAGHGRRSSEQIKAFLDTILDLSTRRVVHRSFDDVLRLTTGTGLAAKTTRGFLASWVERVQNEISPSSFAKYDQTQRLFLESLGGKADQDMASVRQDDIARFRDAQAKRVAPSTANLMLKIVRSIFGAAEADGVVPRNEARHVKTLKVRADKASRRAFTVEEIQRILATCDDEWKSMVRIALYTGARLGDIAGMTWQAIDLEKGELRFVTRKTGRQMIIPLAQPLKEHIEKLPAGDDPKQPLHPRAFAILEREERAATLSRQFGDILADAGLVSARSHEVDDKKRKGRDARRAVSEISFHALRHSMVSFLKTAGVSAAVAMDLAGHESPEVSAHYTHLDHATKREAINKLPRLE